MFFLAPHIRSYKAPCLCFSKKVPLRLSSKQSVGNVWSIVLLILFSYVFFKNKKNMHDVGRRKIKPN